MLLRPCLKCRYRYSCEQRDALRAKLKGAKLTTASFKCEKRWHGLHPGVRVIVTTIDETGYDSGSYEEPPEPIYSEVEVEGTVMHRTGLKVRVWLDKPLVSSGTIRMRAWPCNVKPIGTTIRVCEMCGRPEDKTNRDEWHCDSCESDKMPPHATAETDNSAIQW